MKKKKLSEVLFAIEIGFIYNNKLYAFAPLTLFRKLEDNFKIGFTIEDKRTQKSL